MSYTIDKDTPIGFGKLRGKPHKELLKQVNDNYKTWIVNQGDDFKYNDTRQYILDNCDEGPHIEMKDILEKVMLYVGKQRYKGKQELTELLMELTGELKEHFV